MNRKTLEEMGLTKEQIDTIMKANGEDIENAKSALSATVDQQKAEIDGLSSQIKERDKQLGDLQKAAGDNADLTKQIEELKAANAEATKAHAAEIEALKLGSAIDTAITAAGAKNSKAVKALLDMAKVKLKDDGTVDGLDDQIKALQKAEDSSFLFATNKITLKGAKVGETPDAQDTSVTPEQFAKMGYAEMANLKASNPQAFAQLSGTSVE